MGAPDFPKRPLADKFLHRALVCVNAYKCAKFQLPIFISYWDMEGVSKCKVGAPASRRRPLADKFLYRKLVLVNAYKCAKFRLPGSISLRDKVVVLKLNVGATSPLPYPVRWKFYVCLKYLASSNSVPNFSIVSLWIMQLCQYVFCIGFPLYVPKNGFFLGGFEGEDVKILSSDPKKALPCVNMHLLMYRM